MDEEQKRRGLTGKELIEHLGGLAAVLITNMNNPEKYSGIMAVEQTGAVLSYMVSHPDLAQYVKTLMQRELQIVGRMLEFIKKNPEASKWELVDFIAPEYEKFGDDLLALANEYQRKRIPAAEDFDDKFMKDLKIRMPEANA